MALKVTDESNVASELFQASAALLFRGGDKWAQSRFSNHNASPLLVLNPGTLAPPWRSSGAMFVGFTPLSGFEGGPLRLPCDHLVDPCGSLRPAVGPLDATWMLAGEFSEMC